jgi:HD superfamily phosphohydrolase
MNITELRRSVEAYVDGFFRDYNPMKIEASKAIHDAVLGTNYFLPYEIAFLDLPIVQRLRHISQTDVASYVFPSGNHNRFEHTLGVTTIAGKFVDALFRRNNPLLSEVGKSENEIRQHCRVAAILHDVGHGPFSHLSEQVYADAFEKVREDRQFQGASPHEILSYMIATSERMQQFNHDIIEALYGVEIDLRLVGDIIIGFSLDRPKEVFIVEIVNGAFDADKLDYMLRDSHSTGIDMSLDLSRLLYALDVIDHEDKIRLSIDVSGVVALEQIVFNKMTLFSTIYHHHKVRATGCLLKSIFLNNEKFVLPTDFLQYTDVDIWASAFDDDTKTKMLGNLKNRKIPKRALVISLRTIGDGIENFNDIMKLTSKDITANNGKDIIQMIEREIADRVHKEYGVDVSDAIWVDIPNLPKFKEATTCVIKNFSTTTPILH